MYTIEIVVNGKRVDTLTRERMVEYTSLLSTYRHCGWTINRRGGNAATASRVV